MFDFLLVCDSTALLVLGLWSSGSSPADLLSSRLCLHSVEMSFCISAGSCSPCLFHVPFALVFGTLDKAEPLTEPRAFVSH